MRMNLSKVKMLQVSKCLIGLAVMMLQSCDVVDNRRDMLCGNWESVEGKPDVLIYKEGEAYKVKMCIRDRSYTIREPPRRYSDGRDCCPRIGFSALRDC